MWPLSECQVYGIVLVQHQGGSYGSGKIGNGMGDWYDGANDYTSDVAYVMAECMMMMWVNVARLA